MGKEAYPNLIRFGISPGPGTQDFNQREKSHRLLEVKEEQGVTNDQLDYSGNLSPFAFEYFSPFPSSCLS